MEKKEKKVYEVPQLTAVSFKAERGYAGSGLSTFYLALSSGSLSEVGVSSSLEERSNGGNWGDGSWY